MGGKARRATTFGQADGRAEEEGGVLFLSSLLQAVPAIVLRVDDEFKIQYINQLQSGYTREQVIGTSALDFIPPANAAMARKVYREVLATGTPGEFVVELPYPDGTWYVFRTFVTRVAPIDGRYALCAVALDVSEQVTQQKKLAASEEMLRMATDASQVGLFRWSADTGKIEWNERMKSIVGTETALTFEQWQQTVSHPDDRAGAQANADELRRTGHLGPKVERIIRSDGEARWIVLNAKAILGKDGDVERIFGGVLDITEQQRSEEQLRQFERMQALESLTAGIAHNFNNMLMVIQPCLDVIEGLLQDEDKVWVRDAIEASSRAADMVSQLVSFGGHQQILPHEQVAVHHACQAAVAMCKRAFDSSIKIDWDAQTDAVVGCQRGDLEQVLFNLLINARDARESSDAEDFCIQLRAYDHSDSDGKRVRIEVRDNGVGMSEATRARVFDPFFTTKAEKGTGLGLASCHTIIQRIGGTIDCVSVRGQGTTFAIELPLATQDTDTSLTATEPVAANISPGIKPAAADSAGAKVLIVDDEAAIRRIVTELLDSDGIPSISVGSVSEARTSLKNYAGYELVLLDRSMPGVEGSELIPDLRSKVPQARIIFFTGHEVSEQEAALVDGVLSKPLRGEALLSIVTEVLARES